MKFNSVPLNDTIIMAVAKMIDDSQSEKREPTHSDLDFLFSQVKLSKADPKVLGQTVGKFKRVRAVLNFALENENPAGERMVVKLIDLIRGYGGFREDSFNYVGYEAIKNASDAFRSEGYNLSLNGELRPMVLDNLSEKDMTEALQAYVRRAKRGSLDAALLAGTGKDLLEAVAKHILYVKWGQSDVTSNFPTLLGQAFTALNLATRVEGSKGLPMKRYESSLYEMGCAVNMIRNKEGTGHGRPFLPNISQKEAANAVQAIGIVADYLLIRLND